MALRPTRRMELGEDAMNATQNPQRTMKSIPFRLPRTLWSHLPGALRNSNAMYRVGRLIYDNIGRHTLREQSHFTHFMRNGPLLEALAKRIDSFPQSSTLRVCSVGCSTGAELYSAVFVLRRSRPDLDVTATGMDLCAKVVEVAKRGIYTPDIPAAAGGLFTAGIAEVSSTSLVDLAGILELHSDGTTRVRDWIRDNTVWFAADAADGALSTRLGVQDIVLANNFMGPMDNELAETCLRNMMNLVADGGYLIVDGLDLDLKVRVLANSTFVPVTDRYEDIWNKDTSKNGWPWLRWSREPINRQQPDWTYRYALIFRRTSN